VHEDLSFDIERGVAHLPSAEEVFRAPAPSSTDLLLAEIHALTAEIHALTSDGHAQRAAEEKERRRAERNRAAIDLAIKTLLGK
jgi:hypothetical protein